MRSHNQFKAHLAAIVGAFFDYFCRHEVAACVGDACDGKCAVRIVNKAHRNAFALRIGVEGTFRRRRKREEFIVVIEDFFRNPFRQTVNDDIFGDIFSSHRQSIITFEGTEIFKIYVLIYVGTERHPDIFKQRLGVDGKRIVVIGKLRHRYGAVGAPDEYARYRKEAFEHRQNAAGARRTFDGAADSKIVNNIGIFHRIIRNIAVLRRQRRFYDVELRKSLAGIILICQFDVDKISSHIGSGGHICLFIVFSFVHEVVIAFAAFNIVGKHAVDGSRRDILRRFQPPVDGFGTHFEQRVRKRTAIDTIQRVFEGIGYLAVKVVRRQRVPGRNKGNDCLARRNLYADQTGLRRIISCGIVREKVDHRGICPAGGDKIGSSEGNTS